MDDQQQDPNQKKPTTITEAASLGGKARAATTTPEQRSSIARLGALARQRNREQSEIPRAKHEGSLQLGSVSIPCAVLSDGRRVLTQEGFLEAIGRARKAKAGQGASVVVDETPAFLAAKNLKPFVSEDLKGSTTPIPFRTKTGGRAFGYRAELLADVCAVFIDARDAKALAPSQAHIAARCQTLLNGFAKVGILSLVDDATGYTSERDRNELAKLLELFVAPELLPYARRFPAEFYREMFRLRGWTLEATAQHKPPLVGKITNWIVYERLPPGVLAELRKKNPVEDNGRRKHRFHQFLSRDVGHPVLERHITLTIGLMSASDSWAQFERALDRVAPKFGGNHEIDLRP